MSASDEKDGKPKELAKKDDVEDALGISMYLSSPNDGFSGVLKARYSDFVVHEVGLDGRVARLDSLSADIIKDENGNDDKEKEEEDSNATRKRKIDEVDEADKKPLAPSWEALQTEFSQIVGEDPAQKAIQFLKEDFQKASDQSQTEGEAKDTTIKEQLYVALPPIEDKDTRKKVHQWIKSSSLAPFATADTADDEQGNKVIRFWPRRHETKMPNFGKFDRNGRRHPKQGHRGKEKVSGYLQFVLYKVRISKTTTCYSDQTISQSPIHCIGKL